MVLGGGGDYVPTPYQEAMMIQHTLTPPHKAAVVVWDRPGPEPHTHPPKSVQGDTEPQARPIGNVWQELAVCESGMNGVPRWDYNGNSGFDGGIQFHPNTWTAFKDDTDPDYAYQASPERQIEIGKRVAAAQGAGAWPSCTAKLGISTQDLLQ